jgi:hypothetical protein
LRYDRTPPTRRDGVERDRGADEGDRQGVRRAAEARRRARGAAGDEKYEGVWDAEKVYCVADFVTDGGSLWHCSDTNIGVRPGSSDAWRLAVKRGTGAARHPHRDLAQFIAVAARGDELA